MNRYDVASVAKYDPLSFEQILMVPMMKRKQHDEILAKQELIRAGLAKVNPLDVHYNRALELKKGIESQIDNTALELSKTGVNNDMIGKTIALNRQFNDLVSPTGEIGQINTANEVFKQQREEHIKAAQAAGHSYDDAVRNWGEYSTKKYTGFKDDDKTKIANIDSLGVPKNIDVTDYVDKLAKGAGFTSISDAVSSGGLVDTGVPGANRYVVNSHNKTATGSNLENLKSLAEHMNKVFSDPTSEIVRSETYKGRDVNDTLNQVGSQIGIYRKTNKETERGSSIGSVGWGEQPKPLGGVTSIFDNASATTIDSKNIDFDSIGKVIQGGALYDEKDTESNKQQIRNYNARKGQKITYKDVIQDPFGRKMYEHAYKTLQDTGKLAKTVSINDSRASSLIKNYITTYMPKLTIGHDIINPDISPEAQQFMGGLSGKDATERNATLTQQIDGGNRKMIDIKTGKEYNLDNGNTIEYQGYDSPFNYSQYKFNNSEEQNVMSHRGILRDSKGNVIANVAIERTKNEIAKPEFKRASELNHIYRKVVENPNKWFIPTGKYTNNSNIKNTRVKYNYDGTISLKYNGLEEAMSPAEAAVELEKIMTEIK